MSAEYDDHVPSRNGGKIAIFALAFLLGCVSGSGGDRVLYRPWEMSSCKADNPVRVYSISRESIASVQEAGMRMANDIHPPHMMITETALSTIIRDTQSGKPEKQLQIEIPYSEEYPLSPEILGQAAVAGVFIEGSSGNLQLRVLNPIGVLSETPENELPRVTTRTLC